MRDPGVQFADMNGDGRADLLVIARRQGYFPLSFEGRWSPTRLCPVCEAPTVNFGDNTVRLVDLDGDGVIDALRTGASFELFFNDPQKGWETVETRPRRPIAEFPDVSFSRPAGEAGGPDRRQSSGHCPRGAGSDRLLALPGPWSMGPTRHHEKQPRLPGRHSRARGGFDPKRVLFGDLDGDGLDDILYIEPNRLTFWINRGGERWSDPSSSHSTPPLTDVNAVRLADMLGTGTAGVLWTFDQTAGAASNFQFLDLTGGMKPYLLEQMDNHMGAVTASSTPPRRNSTWTDFDKPETRWKTPLPFPVQVVERVEVIDALSGGKLTTEYRYHHGYWDGAEREFRGFGRSSSSSTPRPSRTINAPGAHGPDTRFEPVGPKAFSPPLLTKTWFHLGPVDDEFAGALARAGLRARTTGRATRRPAAPEEAR